MKSGLEDINSQFWLYNMQLWLCITQFGLYDSQLWVYITQFGEKSQNCKRKSRNYLFYFLFSGGNKLPYTVKINCWFNLKLPGWLNFEFIEIKNSSQYNEGDWFNQQTQNMIWTTFNYWSWFDKRKNVINHENNFLQCSFP